MSCHVMARHVTSSDLLVIALAMLAITQGRVICGMDSNTVAPRQSTDRRTYSNAVWKKVGNRAGHDMTYGIEDGTYNKTDPDRQTSSAPVNKFSALEVRSLRL